MCVRACLFLTSVMFCLDTMCRYMMFVCCLLVSEQYNFVNNNNLNGNQHYVDFSIKSRFEVSE